MKIQKTPLPNERAQNAAAFLGFSLYTLTSNAAGELLRAGVGAILGRVASTFGRVEIGITGRIGEEALKRLGGKSQVRFETEFGSRIVDQLVNGAAHESKVGYQALTKDAIDQIAEDVELMQSGQVNSVTWHFYTSPITGKIGPSQPLLRELESKGINMQYHP